MDHVNCIDEVVSVIIPVYNCQNYIEECLNSIFNQSHPKIEIIIVDDGSYDDSGEICDRYRGDARVKVIHKERNEGLLAARLTGIEYASSEWIVFVDADDWLDTNFVESLLQLRKDADIVCTNARKIFEDTHEYTEVNRIAPALYSGKEKDEIIGRMICFDQEGHFGILPFACNKLFRRSILLPILSEVDKNIFDGEDVAFTYPYILKSDTIVVSNYCGYNYRYRSDSLSNKKRKTEYFNESCLYVWLYGIFNKNRNRDVLVNQLNQYIRMMIWKRNPGEYVKANRFVFPYEKVPVGTKIIIYGNGDMGSAYLEQLRQSKLYEIVAVADQKYQMSDDGFNINPVCINNVRYDFIVVAMANPDIADKVIDYLIQMGVDEKKIIL